VDDRERLGRTWYDPPFRSHPRYPRWWPAAAALGLALPPAVALGVLHWRWPAPGLDGLLLTLSPLVVATALGGLLLARPPGAAPLARRRWHPVPLLDRPVQWLVRVGAAALVAPYAAVALTLSHYGARTLWPWLRFTAWPWLFGLSLFFLLLEEEIAPFAASTDDQVRPEAVEDARWERHHFSSVDRVVEYIMGKEVEDWERLTDHDGAAAQAAWYGLADSAVRLWPASRWGRTAEPHYSSLCPHRSRWINGLPRPTALGVLRTVEAPGELVDGLSDFDRQRTSHDSPGQLYIVWGDGELTQLGRALRHWWLPQPLWFRSPPPARRPEHPRRADSRRMELWLERERPAGTTPRPLRYPDWFVGGEGPFDRPDPPDLR
jgi:hypothetical protein